MAQATHDPTGKRLTRFHYYGLVEHHGRIAEVLVTRDGGRQIDQALTGVTYSNMRVAERANAAKNRAVRPC